MADFCQQCSLDLFGEDYRELAGLATREAEDLHPVVICEGCGYIQVDNAGRCVSDDCLVDHKPPSI